MKNIAQIYLDGNLTADPEAKELQSERALTTFRVAANHDWNLKDGNKTVSYFNVECWEKLAENCARFLKKGDHVTLIGDLRQDRWRDAEGQPRSSIKIVARYVRFDSLRPKKAEAPSEADEASDTPAKTGSGSGQSGTAKAVAA
ncbi:MAG: single-stranded DNA-binding protein [Leptospirales bacterium]|jgi:single-strand DNA-binding protein